MRYMLLFGTVAGSLCLSAPARTTGQVAAPLKVLQTKAGIRFGILGIKGAAPAPVLFVLASGLEESLKSKDFARAGHILLPRGFLCVAVDMPCHGQDTKAQEPAGLAGWRRRLENGDDLVSALNKKLSAVLDHLLDEGYADPKKIAVCGTSRGGFMALHFAAAEPRVRCVAAFAPVTDLLVVKEFSGMEKNAAVKSLDLSRRADKLAGRAVWLCIGNNDLRVGTDQAIAFTRKVTEASLAQKKPANVELHVMPSLGHTIHPTAHDEVAAWILAQLGPVAPK